MTTIAFDGKSIALDGRGCMGKVVSGDSEIKWRLVRTDQGHMLMALSGVSAMMDPLANWVAKGAKVADVPPCQDADNGGWTMVVVDRLGPPSNALRYRFMCDKLLYFDVVETPFAIGSGGHAALVAMHCGLTAREAVQLVIDKKLDVWTGGVVQEYDILDMLLNLSTPQEVKQVA